MQNTMLDSTVSNSLQLFADKGFKIRVIMCLGDPWFVAKDACDCLTLTDTNKACQNLDDDEKQVVTRDFDSELFSESKAQAMTLISESGLYTLIMRSNKPEAKVFRKWVTSEVLPSIRKTGKYAVKEQSVMLPDFCNPAEAARAWADLYEKNQAIELRAITAESERDEAIRTKAMIGSNREATAMATASAKSRECEKLREQIGDSKTYKAAKAIPWLSEYFNTRNRGLYNALAHKLKKIEADMPSEFAHIMIDDSQYGEIKAYHVAVIEKLHEMVQADEELMKDYRKDVSPKSKNT